LEYSISLKLPAHKLPKSLPEAAKRIERVLMTDPGMGMIRHADAGYEEAIEFAEKNDVKIPMQSHE